MDFSHPYMLAGLQILTRVDDRPRLIRYLQSATDSGAARALAFLVGFIILCAHVMFLAERGSDSISRIYFPGIFEAAWFVVATMTTVGYGDVTPHRWLGRFVAFVVMVTGIGLFGVLIADLSTGMTLQEVQARLSGPSDLAGRTVATIHQSTSVDVARSHGAVILERETLDEAVAALIADGADAVVFDGPALLHYVQRNADEGLVVVPTRLTVETYAVAFPSGSPIRETVNRSLLELQENGERDRLYEKWFGIGP
jgi:ABC-type amino acid transport substrate-binding protein